jgi:hypothetical protein
MSSAHTGVADRPMPWFAWVLSAPLSRPSPDRSVDVEFPGLLQQPALDSNETPPAIAEAQTRALRGSHPRAILPQYPRCSSRRHGRAEPRLQDLHRVSADAGGWEFQHWGPEREGRSGGEGCSIGSRVTADASQSGARHLALPDPWQGFCKALTIGMDVCPVDDGFSI